MEEKVEEISLVVSQKNKTMENMRKKEKKIKRILCEGLTSG